MRLGKIKGIKCRANIQYAPVLNYLRVHYAPSVLAFANCSQMQTTMQSMNYEIKHSVGNEKWQSKKRLHQSRMSSYEHIEAILQYSQTQYSRL